jgi:hypothetical protein
MSEEAPHDKKYDAFGHEVSEEDVLPDAPRLPPFVQEWLTFLGKAADNARGGLISILLEKELVVKFATIKTAIDDDPEGFPLVTEVYNGLFDILDAFHAQTRPEYLNGKLVPNLKKFIDEEIKNVELKDTRPSIEGLPFLIDNKVEGIDAINKHFSMVNDQGKLIVMYDNPLAGPQRLKKEDFEAKLAPHKFTGGQRPADMSKIWWDYPLRSYYDHVVFDPSWKHGQKKGIYNLWRGFPVAPIEGDCTPALDFMEKIIANCDEETYLYLMEYQALLIQRPWILPEIMIVLLSKHKGVGKSFWIEKIIARLVGQYYHKAHNAKQAFSTFNEHLERCIVLHFEEIRITEQYSHQLNNYITGGQYPIEPKGFRQRMCQNFLHCLMSANNDDEMSMIYTTVDERRLAVFNPSEERTQDHKYFGELDDWFLRDSGLGKYIWHLGHYPLGTHNVNIRKPPKTNALRVQQRQNLKGFKKFLYDLVVSERLPFIEMSVDGYYIVPKVALQNRYNSKIDRYSRGSYRGAVTSIGRELHELIPSLGPDTKRGKEPCYKFPNLRIVRSDLEKYLVGDWETPTADAWWIKDEGIYDELKLSGIRD